MSFAHKAPSVLAVLGGKGELAWKRGLLTCGALRSLWFYNAAERLIDRETRDAVRLLLDQASQQNGACCTMQNAW